MEIELGWVGLPHPVWACLSGWFAASDSHQEGARKSKVGVIIWCVIWVWIFERGLGLSTDSGSGYLHFFVADYPCLGSL